MAGIVASFAKSAISHLSVEERRKIAWFVSSYSSTCVQKVFKAMSTEALKKKLEDTEQPTAKKMKVEPKCVLRFAKITENAFVPVRGSERSAGMDLCSAYDLMIPARGKAVVKTDLQVQLPEGCYGRLAPRSGLAVKHFIDVGAGVVDEDYRGNIGVVLFNHSDKDFEVMRGDRIAQLICERVFYPELEQVDKLDDTVRGDGGFGSTGVKDVNGKDSNGTAKMDTKEVKDESDKKTAKAAEVGDKESKAKDKEAAKEGNGAKKSEATNGKETASKSKA